MSNPLSAPIIPAIIEEGKEDWKELVASNGIAYYYNTKVLQKMY
jgi:hypothetical protein